MKTKYNTDIEFVLIEKRLRNILNQIYKLLPIREEKQDWQKPLQTILQQLIGFGYLFNIQDSFLSLLTKLSGLYSLVKDQDFQLYRRTIFECIGILDRVIKECQQLQLKD